MAFYDDMKLLLGAIEAIRSLRERMAIVAKGHEDLRDRVAELEQKDKIRDLEFTHFTERAKAAAEAGVSIGIARMEGDLKAKIVELDLRLQAVERGAGTASLAKQLPSA